MTLFMDSETIYHLTSLVKYEVNDSAGIEPGDRYSRNLPTVSVFHRSCMQRYRGGTDIRANHESKASGLLAPWHGIAVGAKTICSRVYLGNFVKACGVYCEDAKFQRIRIQMYLQRDVVYALDTLGCSPRGLSCLVSRRAGRYLLTWTEEAHGGYSQFVTRVGFRIMTGKAAIWFFLSTKFGVV